MIPKTISITPMNKKEFLQPLASIKFRDINSKGSLNYVKRVYMKNALVSAFYGKTSLIMLSDAAGTKADIAPCINLASPKCQSS